MSYNRIAGTATEGAGQDYVLPTPASVTIPVMSLSAEIVISILDDLLDETNENIVFDLTGANLVAVDGANDSTRLRLSTTRRHQSRLILRRWHLMKILKVLLP